MTPEQIKAIRATLRMSQAELARLLGVSLGAVTKWEQGYRECRGAAALLLKRIQEEGNIMENWTYAKNDNIEIRIDFVRPESTVYYRVIGDKEWETTPFQSHKFNFQGGYEQAALSAVDEWSSNG